MPSMWRRSLVAITLGVLFVHPAAAQVSTSAVPVFHGTLDVKRPAHGTINRRTGQVSLRVTSWAFKPVESSNGVFPAQEPVIVALGEDSFRIEAGGLKARRRGTLFVYRAPHSTNRGVRRLRIWSKKDGTYGVSFVLGGADLSRLNIEDPVCVPLALIVGDDDGFTGVTIGSTSFVSHRISIPSSCSAGNDWPWIQS
jgi:hypothetical protein